MLTRAERPATVVCLGEILVDAHPGGCETPGGAPANVACHVATLGCRAALVSRVGSDARGARLQAWLEQIGVDVSALTVDAAQPTGFVRVSISDRGPAYEIAAPAAWDFLRADAAARAAVCSAGVVVLGTLGQRHPVARAAIRQLVEEARGNGAHILADLNLRPPFFDQETILWSLRHANVLKLNTDELRTVSGLLGARGETLDLWTGLLREFGLCRSVLTDGAAGSWIFEDETLHHEPACPVEVADTVGAGDACTAVLATALANGLTLRHAAPWAAEVAAFVASQPGATPALPPQLAGSVRAALQPPPAGRSFPRSPSVPPQTKV
ncbi:MAG: PfkB family carbohydrate kinase [Chthoniobacterales bacterium]